MADEIHKGDIGTIFRITITEAGAAVNVSTATTKTFKFTKPDGTVVEKAASFTGSGSDGQLQYTTIADDLDQAGSWQVQPYLVMTGFTGHKEINQFSVVGNLS